MSFERLQTTNIVIEIEKTIKNKPRKSALPETASELKAKTENKAKSEKKKSLTINDEVDCKCLKIISYDVKWLESREYGSQPGQLAMDDWTRNPYIWLHYIQKSDGILVEDDALLSKESEYWDIEEAQRFFTGEHHCEKVMFPYPYPYPRLRTPLANHFWRSNIALKLQSNLYQRELYSVTALTLKRMVIEQAQIDRLIVSDAMIKLDRLDYFRRKEFLQSLQHVLSSQERLQLVSFENMCCKRIEGVSLIQHLACFNAHSLKYLFLWRFVLPNENPLLINYSYITGSGLFIPRPNTRHTFLRSLGELRNLRVLALEYAHIADGSGGALLSLLPVIKRQRFRLQLICREDQIPGRADASLGVGGYDIPDTIWRHVAVACPDLYLLLAFFRVRDYDNIRRFLTPSIPLREVHLQLGIDLKMRQRQDSDISCFIRHIAYRYADTLVTLSIHQWRFAVFPLRRIFELMPRLVRLFYIGKVSDDVELKRLFQMIALGVCKNLKQIKIQIQDDDIKMDYWRNVVESITEEFTDIMQLFDIKFCISLYKT